MRPHKDVRTNMRLQLARVSPTVSGCGHWNHDKAAMVESLTATVGLTAAAARRESARWQKTASSF